MYNTRNILSAAIIFACGGPLCAAPITFELNDTGIGNGSVTGVGTTVVTATGGIGLDALSLTLGASSTGGTTVAAINEGGGGGQSGLGINVTGANSSNSGNEAQDVSSNNPPNPINETFLLSFTDDMGNPVAVKFISAEVSRLAGTAESVIVSVDGAVSTIFGADSGGSNGAFSTAFAGSPELAAGNQASFAPGVGTSYRIHSLTVEEVIPEPASLLVIGTGFLAVAARRRTN